MLILLFCYLAILPNSVPDSVAAIVDSAQYQTSVAAEQLTLIPFAAEIDSAARLNNVPPELLAAVIQEESRWDPWATRVEQTYLKNAVVRRSAQQWSQTHSGIPTSLTERYNRATSYGLTQVMGETAREQGFNERYLARLYLPANALMQGARLLHRLLIRYRFDTLSAVSAYNQGNARRDHGVFENAQYVYRVTVAWKAYRRIMNIENGHVSR